MNGQNDTGSTEATPLLGDTRSSTRNGSPARIPAMNTTLRRLEDTDVHSLDISDLSNLPFPSDAAQAAYTLIILLRLRSHQRKPSRSSRDVYMRWTHRRHRVRSLEHLDQLIHTTWSEYLREYQIPEDIEDVLWFEFFLDESRRRRVRVVDCLIDPNSPSDLLSHPAVEFSLTRTWKYGRFVEVSGETISERILRFYDTITTPRTLLALDIIYQLVFIGLYVHFIIYPSRRPVILNGTFAYGTRELLILVLSLSSLVPPLTTSFLPHVLVLLPLLACLPLTPYPGETAFNVMLLALPLLLVQLHLPRAPSLLFVFPVDATLPLATFLFASLGMLSSALIFILPVAIFTFVLLSASLADSVSTYLFNGIMDVSPMETRTLLLTLLGGELLFFLWSLLVLCIYYPTFLTLVPSVGPWDRYSKAIGNQARIEFLRAVRIYSSPYYFPPPLNLLRFAIISIPCAFIYVTGGDGTLKHFKAAGKVLWRLTVGPIGFVVAGLWIWGARG